MLRLKFEGVAQIEVHQRWQRLFLSLLEIFSIREQQWEGLNYYVHDTEEDVLSFYCYRFEAEVLGPSEASNLVLQQPG